MIRLAAILACCMALGVAAEPAELGPQIDLAAPPPAFVAVAANLRAVAVMRADFRQVKQIKALTRPLVSEGRLLFSRDDGIRWATTTPFPSVYVITPEAILEQQDDGTYRRFAVRDLPVAGVIAGSLTAAFSGDTARLGQAFTVHFTGDADAWRLGLVPKDAQLKRAIAAIVIAGGRLAEAITIAETNGDTSVVTFAQVTLQPPTLTPEEKVAFEAP